MTASARKFGFELEYASNTTAMVAQLFAAGVMRTRELHGYHCDCADCAYVEMAVWTPRDYDDHECDDHCADYGCWMDDDHYANCGRRSCPSRNRPSSQTTMQQPADLRAQRDSTADGEFITRPLTDWDDLQRITAALTTAATNAGAQASTRCGLHVHVDTSSDGDLPMREHRRRIVPAAYLAFERYFTEIVAPGASERKRDMNSTLMEATRQWVSDQYGGSSDVEMWMDTGRGELDALLLNVIGRDRHVDLNWSRRHNTWEFRCFNSTNAPWRIELACRMSVAFVEAAPQLRELVESTVKGSRFWPVGCDSPWGEIVRPAYRALPTGHPTKKPVVPMSDFVDALCAVDPDLRPLIERQASYMRTRFAATVEHAS